MFKINKLTIFFLFYVFFYIVGVFFLKEYFNLSFSNLLYIVLSLMLMIYIVVNIKIWYFEFYQYFTKLKQLLFNFDIQDSSNFFQYSLTGGLDFGLSAFLYKQKLKKYIKINTNKDFLNKVFLLIELSLSKGDNFFYYLDNIDEYGGFKYKNLKIKEINTKELNIFLKNFNIEINLKEDRNISLSDCLNIVLEETKSNEILRKYIIERYNLYFAQKPLMMKVFLSLSFHKHSVFEFVSFFQKEFTESDILFINKKIENFRELNYVVTIQQRAYSKNFYEEHYDYNILPLNYLDIIKDFKVKNDLLDKFKDYFKIYKKCHSFKEIEKEIDVLIGYLEKIIIKNSLDLNLNKLEKNHKKVFKV